MKCYEIEKFSRIPKFCTSISSKELVDERETTKDVDETQHTSFLFSITWNNYGLKFELATKSFKQTPVVDSFSHCSYLKIYTSWKIHELQCDEKIWLNWFILFPLALKLSNLLRENIILWVKTYFTQMMIFSPNLFLNEKKNYKFRTYTFIKSFRFLWIFREWYITSKIKWE